MILSLDTTLAFLLTAVAISVFFQASGNADFSVREIAAQRFTDSLALSLQESTLLINLHRQGNSAELERQVEKIKGNYCIVITVGEDSAGNCDNDQREKIKRSFLTFDKGEFIQASVETYFS